MKPLAARLTERRLIQRGDLTLAYFARDGVLDRPVFVKVLSPALAADREIRARFEREARAVARLDHPNLVRIFEFGEDPAEGPYMLLEWLDSATLGQRIGEGQRWSGDAWIELATQLLRGLAALHGVGILHRDLKPDNILIRRSAADSSQRHGIYKITDFSLAALRDAPKLTHHEAIVGTPAYMSPEQAGGGQPAERSDLFALGVVLWEAATGHNPFTGATMLETLQHVRERDVPADAAISALPPAGQGLLTSLLEKNPARRPESARAALAALGVTRADEVNPRRARPTRRRNALHLSAAVLVIAIWIVLMFVWPWDKTTPHEEAASPADTAAKHAESVVMDTSAADSVILSHVSLAAPRSDASRQIIPPPAGNTVREPVIELRAAPPPDSVDLFLHTEPWAHVFLDGMQLGTTPLGAPLRVPGGAQRLVLRNPAFPPVQVDMDLRAAIVHEEIQLADYAALLRVSVQPWGELYLDGEHIGTTPLARPLFVSPGRHVVRISHPQLTAVQEEFAAAPGETLAVNADLHRTQLAVRQETPPAP